MLLIIPVFNLIWICLLIQPLYVIFANKNFLPRYHVLKYLHETGHNGARVEGVSRDILDASGPLDSCEKCFKSGAPESQGHSKLFEINNLYSLRIYLIGHWYEDTFLKMNKMNYRSQLKVIADKEVTNKGINVQLKLL